MNSHKGMTLIEVVIVIAIIAVFLGSACGVIANFLFSSTTGQNFLTASRIHERAMTVIREELLQTSANMVVPKFWIYDENGNEITYVEGSENPGTKIRFRKFFSFSLTHIGSSTVGKCNFFVEVEFYRAPDTDCVMRRQRQWNNGIWGDWGEPQVIGSYCTDLTFTELPVRKIKIFMRNEVGEPQEVRSYVGIFDNSVEVTPQN